MVPTVLSARAPEIATTSIEIDPEVVNVAKRFFGFAPDDNDRVIVGDGRRMLDAQVASTDVILVDAYFSDSIPFHLVTEEFDALCKRRMTSKGALALNFDGTLSGKGNALFWASVKTLQKVFLGSTSSRRSSRQGGPRSARMRSSWRLFRPIGWIGKPSRTGAVRSPAG